MSEAALDQPLLPDLGQADHLGARRVASEAGGCAAVIANPLDGTCTPHAQQSALCSSCDQFSPCAGVCLTDFVTPCNTGLDCACTDGRCLGTDFPCQTGADCAVECVQMPSGSDTIGVCETQAKACGKDSGVSCTELTSGTPACQGL